MPDLPMYELEDIIWDDFDRVDDHIVPHHTNARMNRNSVEGDSCKKPRFGTTSVLSNADNLEASNSICQGKEGDFKFKPLDMKKNITEKEPLSHAPPDIFNASIDDEIVKDMPNLASDDARTSCFKSSYASSGGEFHGDDHVLSGASAAGERNSYSYPLTHISQTEDLCFIDNDCEDKELTDLLYYGWPDIGNFEDVDKMLRNCDSSFGLGTTDNDNELGWFTSDQIGCTEESLKMDFKFPCPEPGALKNISQDHATPESNNQRSGCTFEGKDELNLEDQVNLQKKQSKHQNHMSDFKSDDSRLSSINKSDRGFTSVSYRQQYRDSERDCFGHMQSNTSYLHPDYSHAPYLTTGGTVPSGIKSEHKGLKSPSPKESSYASNQGHSMESCSDPSYQGTAKEDERQQVHNSQGFQPLFIGNPRQICTTFEAPKSDLVSAQKQAHLSTNEFESGSDTDGVQKGVSAEIRSLKVPESSSVSSELDEISLEATSFRQLQQVMEQLDLRTKLCIRDSLYRLARSAEQRHNNPSLSSSTADINEVGGPSMTEKTNNGFMDMETDTNPIDRSVAHLLFHRPSESCNLPLNPNATSDGIGEKVGCDDEEKRLCR